MPMHQRTVQIDAPYYSDARRALLDEASRHGLTHRLVCENGPAGGNPVYEVTGFEDELRAFLEVNCYDAQLEELDDL